MDISDTETLMLQRQDTVDDCVDYRGRPVHRANSGGWKSALFIIGVEMAERFAFCGTGSNLITYLTGPLGQSTATAAQNANKWSGTSQLLPLLGAFVVLAQGGQRPCVQAVGADQFDEKHPEECKLKIPFFNWWYFGMCTSSIFTHFIISSVQENLYWGLGFGIPCISMAIAPIVFLLGTKSYRYTMKGNGMNPFLRIGKVFVAAIRNLRAAAPSAMALEQEAGTIYSDQVPLVVPPDGSEAYAKAPSISEVEEAKALLRLVPIWTKITVYGIVSAQQPTFFTKQEARMDRSITPGSRDLTEKAAGITMLQRFGIGLFFSVIEMVTPALVEMKRLKTAQAYGLVDKPGVIIPMGVWWLIPQHVLFGVSESFAMVCLQEHFYDQVPTELRSVCLSLYLSIF
ncbi:hypothetical protein CICLE_v10003928mg, partial [Citrus x clementina]